MPWLLRELALLWDLIFHPVSLPPACRADSVGLYEMLSPDRAKEAGFGHVLHNHKLSLL